MSDPRARMGGQVLPLVGVMLTVMLCMCALAVDLGGAWRVEAAQKQRLELAKEAVMADLVVVKTSTSATNRASWDAANALALDGYAGQVTVWAAELPESVTGALDRLVVVRVELSQTYESTLAGLMGKGEIPVSSAITFSINPYSSTVVERAYSYGPAEHCSKLSMELVKDASGSRRTTYRSHSEADVARSALPGEMFEEANAALTRLSGCGGTTERWEK